MSKQLNRRAAFSAKNCNKYFADIAAQKKDWELLGMKWERLYFFNMVLPCGLRSVPFLFDEFSSALVWIMRNKLHISKVIHILDDFSMPNFTPFDKSKYPHSSWENLPCMYLP